MTDPYRTNAVDETEVAKERVRQTAGTRRKEIEEREATKRAKAKEAGDTERSRGDGWIVPWLVGLTGLLIVAVAAYNIYDSWLDAKYPARRAEACVETAEIVTVSAEKRLCSNGGVFESAPGPKADELYIHCKCPAARSDGAK